MASSTSFDAVNNVGTRFHTQRINRRLDDRDNVIKEAVAILEEKDRSYFPTVEKIFFAEHDALSTSVGYSAAKLASGASKDLTVKLTGTQLGKTTDTHSIRLAGLSNVTGNSPITYFKDITPKSDNSETELVFTIDVSVFSGSDGLNDNPAAGEVHLLQIHVNETLATEMLLSIIA